MNYRKLIQRLQNDPRRQRKGCTAIRINKLIARCALKLKGE